MNQFCETVRGYRNVRRVPLQRAEGIPLDGYENRRCVVSAMLQQALVCIAITYALGLL